MLAAILALAFTLSKKLPNSDFCFWDNQCHILHFSSESHRESLSGEEDNWPRVTIWLHGPVVPGAAEERE